jgi:competence protein ComEA
VFVAVAVVAAALLGGAWYGSRPPRLPPAAEVVSATAPVAGGGTLGIITVHIAGAVVNPGLVAIPDGSRIADAVAAAGGALPSADLGALNLAAPVRESDRVEVPVVGAAGSAGDDGSGDGGVDLNRASAAELEALPGVGPVLAARIVAHRDANGPFTTVEDLLDVPGIGEAKLAALRDGVAAP